MKTKYRAVRSQIFDFLGVAGFDEILSLIYTQSLRDSAAQRARILLGNMFGIDQSGQDIRRYLRDYARTADDVVNSLRAKCWHHTVHTSRQQMR